jgi:PAS domain S-box-containing protein
MAGQTGKERSKILFTTPEPKVCDIVPKDGNCFDTEYRSVREGTEPDRFDGVVTGEEVDSSKVALAVVDEPGTDIPEWADDIVIRGEGWMDVAANRIRRYLDGGGVGTGGLDMYRDFVENSSDVVTLIDEDGVFSYNSPSINEKLGYEQGELVGESVFEYIHPDDRASVVEKFEELVENTETDTRKAEFRIRKANGEYVWFESVATDKRDSGSEGIVVNGRDITERREAERKLSLRTRAIEKAGTSVVITDPTQKDNPIIYVNEGFEELTGYSEEVAVGENCRFLQGPDTDPESIGELRKAIEREEQTKVEILNYTKEAEKFWNQIQISPIYEGDEVVRYVGSQRDVTELKNREERVRRANERLRAVYRAVNKMASATSREAVRDAAVSAVESICGDGDYYVWDEEVGGLCDGAPKEARTAYVSKEASQGSEGSYFPVGNDGVLRVGGKPDASVTEAVESVVSSTEGALDRVEGRNEILELTKELEEREKKLEQLSETDEAIRKLMSRLPDVGGREGVEKSACETLTDVRGWSFGWVGERSEKDGLRVRAATERYPAEAISKASGCDGSPAKRVLSEGDVVVVDSIAKEPDSKWRKTVLEEGYLSVAAVPISHSERTYSVLEIYSEDRGTFSGSAEILTDVGRMLGYAVSSEDRRNIVFGDSYEEVTVAVSGVRTPMRRLAEAADGEVSIKGYSTAPDGYVVRATVEGNTDEVASKAGVESSGSEIKAKVGSCRILETVTEFGGRLRGCRSQNGEVQVRVELTSGGTARELVDALSERFGDARLVSNKRKEKSDIGGDLSDSLTERQMEALKTAYHEGFFEVPRESTGDEIAEKMGISGPTFHRHLRLAEKEIFDGVV